MPGHQSNPARPFAVKEDTRELTLPLMVGDAVTP